jgi:hypothetical protein
LTPPSPRPPIKPLLTILPPPPKKNNPPKIGNLPHVELTFRTASGATHSALFMVDSGAGGADLLFHGRATRELSLATRDELEGRSGRVRSVRGVGGEGQAAMQVLVGELEWADWGGERFDKVRRLSLRGGGSGRQRSPRSAWGSPAVAVPFVAGGAAAALARARRSAERAWPALKVPPAPPRKTPARCARCSLCAAAWT